MLKAVWDSRLGLAARGRQTIVFQVSPIEAIDSSLERYWVVDQKLSLEHVWKVNGLAARGRQCQNFQSGYYLTYKECANGDSTDFWSFFTNRRRWVYNFVAPPRPHPHPHPRTIVVILKFEIFKPETIVVVWKSIVVIKIFKIWRPRELEPRDICPFDSLAIVLNRALL